MKNSPENTKPNYYAVLTADVRYSKKICANAKLLYAEITALSGVEGYCWASNKYFADLYEVDERTIRKWLSALENENFINIDTQKNGMTWNRKIYIFKNISTRGPKGPDREAQKGRIERPKRATYHYNVKHSKEVLEDNVCGQQQSAGHKAKKTMDGTLPFSSKKGGTLDCASLYKLNEEQREAFNFLKERVKETDDKTLSFWAKTYPLQRLIEVYEESILNNPKKLGAYMQKLLKTNANVAKSHAKMNKEFAELFRSLNKNNNIEIKQKYVKISHGNTSIELEFNMLKEEFERSFLKYADQG